MAKKKTGGGHLGGASQNYGPQKPGPISGHAGISQATQTIFGGPQQRPQVPGESPAATVSGGWNFGSGPLTVTPNTPGPGYTGPAAAPPAFDPNNLPLDPSYDAEILGLGNQHTSTVAGLTQQRQYELGTYGYTEGLGADGKPTLTYDPNNPYSQAAVARQRYQEAKLGTTNGMASRGQLYSSALTHAQGINDNNFAIGEDQRQKALLAFLARNSIAKNGADNAYQTAQAQAQGSRLSRALQNYLAQNPTS